MKAKGMQQDENNSGWLLPLWSQMSFYTFCLSVFFNSFIIALYYLCNKQERRKRRSLDLNPLKLKYGMTDSSRNQVFKDGKALKNVKLQFSFSVEFTKKKRLRVTKNKGTQKFCVSLL